MSRCLEYSRYYLDYIPNRYEYREQCPEAQKYPELQRGKTVYEDMFQALYTYVRMVTLLRVKLQTKSPRFRVRSLLPR